MPLFWKRNGWGQEHAVAAVVMVAAGVAITANAWLDILSIAISDEESSHIFLVPIIFAWLVWVRRERLRFCRPTEQWVGSVLVAAGAAVSAFGYYYSYQSLWHGGALVLVLGCFVSAVGVDVIRRFLPAFVVLVFLVPVPGAIRQKIALPLQSELAQITQFVFDLVGVTVQRRGNMLSINDVPVQIAEACNGLRMVFALGLVCYAFTFGVPLRGYVRAIILIATPICALFCNLIRMIPTVWLYGMSGQEVFGVSGESLAQGFHDVAGWIMLLVAFGLLMSIIKVLQWALIPVQPYTLASE